MKKRKGFMVRYLAPAMVCFLAVFLYPTIRTILMSFFKVDFITDDLSAWSFNGLENYQKLFTSPVFKRSLQNVLKIWFIEGAIVICLALLFAVIITSGVKGKNFWRAVVYLPHIISVVALVTMWVHYVFNNQYGLFTTLFEKLGLHSLAAFQWTAPNNLFLSMMIAYAYGSVGFYVLILVAGMDGIPVDYYEAATIEGANARVKFFRITLPLLKDIVKRCIILYSAGAIGFFAYSSLFSFKTEMSTVTPIVYMYEIVFGSADNSAASLNAGAGAAVGVIVMVMVLVVNAIMNRIIKTDAEGY